MPLKVGVPAETYPDEFRVAMTPRAVELLAGSGVEVVVETGAGDAAGFSDSEFESKTLESRKLEATSSKPPP